MTPGWLINWGSASPPGVSINRLVVRFLLNLVPGWFCWTQESIPRCIQRLATFGEFVGRPPEIVPVGLEMLGLLLAKQVKGFPHPPSSERSPPRNSPVTKAVGLCHVV